MKDDIVKLTCPSCGGNQFTRKPGGYLECQYCLNHWKHKEDGHMELIGYKRCKCGQLNSPDSVYCQHCRSRLKMECPNCDRLVDLEAIYCPRCMVNIDEALSAKHKSQIQALEDTIANKETEIASLERQIQTIKQVSKKLFLWGKLGLSDEEKTVYSQLNANLGCLSPTLLPILAFVIIEWIGREVFLRSTLANLKTVDEKMNLIALNLFAAVILGRLVAALILHDVRMNRADQYCEPYLWQKSQITNQIQILKEDIDRLNTEYNKLVRERSEATFL